MWYERKKKFLAGVALITGQLSDETFERSLKQYKELTTEIVPITDDELTHEQRSLISKTLFYIVQRLNLFLLSPIKLQSDLKELGFSERKTELLIEFYSFSNRNIIQNLKTGETAEDEIEINWESKNILHDEMNLKCKKPVARLCVKANQQELIVEGHSDLLTLFDSFENIQRELDALSANK